MPDALGEKHRGQLREVTAWLLEIYPDRATAAREVIARFGANGGVWDKPSPPHLPQIKTDWKRMERILDFQKQTQNPPQNGISNHATNSNGHAKPQNDFQRAAAERRQLRGELGSRYAGRGEANGNDRNGGARREN